MYVSIHSTFTAVVEVITVTGILSYNIYFGSHSYHSSEAVVAVSRTLNILALIKLKDRQTDRHDHLCIHFFPANNTQKQ